MRKTTALAHVLTFVGILGGGTAYPSRADATSVGASVGYGTAGGNPNAYGLGFLGRLGFSLPLNLYAGANFVYHLGTSNEIPAAKASQNVWYGGAEVGYDFHAAGLAIRPFVGLGGLVLQSEECLLGICAQLPTLTSIYVAPGLYARYDFGPVYVGGEVRYVIVTDMTHLDSFGFFASFGVNL